MALMKAKYNGSDEGRTVSQTTLTDVSEKTNFFHADRDVCHVLRVGYIFPEKKKKMMLDFLASPSRFYSYEIHFVEIDINSLEKNIDCSSYGHLDVILHKLAHDMVFEKFCEKSRKRLKVVSTFLMTHPNVVVIDPLDSIRPHINRYTSLHLLKLLSESENCQGLFKVPTFWYIEEIAQIKSITFPLICKAVDACGTKAAHHMKISMSESDLVDLETPYILQEYIDHDETLFKIYVLGNHLEIFERRSLPNLSQHTDLKSLAFDTQTTYPMLEDFQPTIRKKFSYSQVVTKTASDDLIRAHLKDIARLIGSYFNLSLFGVDVIIHQNNLHRTYYVIDLNYFPSYKEIEEVDNFLKRHIIAAYEAKQKTFFF